MNKGGIGFGSASIVLIFAVLCLTIFSLISYIVTQNSKALVDAEANLVIGYYKADAAAQLVLAELLLSDGSIPASIRGVEIDVEHSTDADSKLVSFSYPIYNTDAKVLFVQVAIFQNSSYDLLSWRMINTAQWEKDDGLNVALD